MSLAVMPVIERMLLAVVETVPEWHPEHATFEPFPVFGWVVRHPDGPISSTPASAPATRPSTAGTDRG